MKVVELPINKIIPYENNPRNNENTIEKLKASITEFGYINLIAVDVNNVVVVGHTRLEALKQLKYKKVKCFVLDLPAKKIQEYRLVDNKTAELAMWNEDFLAAELREVGEDMQKFTDTFNIDELLKEDIGSGVDSVTPDSFEAQEQKTAQSAPTGDYKYREITCPECNEKFTIRL